MAGGSDKRIAKQNVETLKQLGMAMRVTQLIQLSIIIFIRSYRSRSHIVMYCITSLPAFLLFAQLYSMGTPKFKQDPSTGKSTVLVSSGDDLAQSGLTSYMQDVLYVIWAAQMVALVWSKGWWLLAAIPAYAGYKAWNLASPFLFQGNGGANGRQRTQAPQTGPGAETLSKRQQKLKARYEKGDRRYQVVEKKVPQGAS